MRWMEDDKGWEREFESAKRVGKRFGFGFGFGMKMGDVGCRRAMRDDSDEEDPDSELDVDDEDEGDQEE